MVRAASTASFLKTRIIISFYAVIGMGILEIKSERYVVARRTLACFLSLFMANRSDQKRLLIL